MDTHGPVTVQKMSQEESDLAVDRSRTEVRTGSVWTVVVLICVCVWLACVKSDTRWGEEQHQHYGRCFKVDILQPQLHRSECCQCCQLQCC